MGSMARGWWTKNREKRACSKAGLLVNGSWTSASSSAPRVIGTRQCSKRMIVERSCGKTGDSVWLGMQIGLHGIQTARGAVGIFAAISLCHPAELGQQRTERSERDRLGDESVAQLAAADPVLRALGRVASSS